MCSTNVTQRYFGHWLYDGLPHELWAHDRSLLPMTIPPPASRTHEPGYRLLADMPACHVDAARIDRFWYLEDHELTDSRIERVQRVRERIRRKAAGGGPSHVYICRGVTGVGREIVNELEVAECLERRGVTILEPEKADPQTIVNTLANARVVISVEGSATGHAVMAAPSDAILVTLFPPTHMNMLFKTHADALGFGFAVGVGETISQERFRMPTERLERLLDLVD
jgi:capsular polysaccharide biosynthesis protein